MLTPSTCSLSDDNDSTSEQAFFLTEESQAHPSFLHRFLFFLEEQAFGSFPTPYPIPFALPLPFLSFVGLLDGLSVGDLEGVRVGSLDRGEMVGEPAGRAGQNVGQALAISDCFVVEMEAVTCV